MNDEDFFDILFNNYSEDESEHKTEETPFMEQTGMAQRRQGLKQQIYQDLKGKLIRCVYPPGTELNELLLTEEYGVSRTPIREAISQLELEGYVKVLPKKGISITGISIDDMLEIFQTRIEIEPVTMRLAAPYLDVKRLLEFRWRFEEPEEDLEKASRLDMEMHLYIIDCCRNSYLIDMMHKLFDDNTRLVIATGQNQVKIHEAKREHIEILDSLISKQDIEASTQLMKKHIETCRAAALKYFSSEAYRKYQGMNS